MLHYIYKDIASVAQYLTIGMAIGIPVAAVFVGLINSRRKRRGEEKLRVISFFCFWIYLMFMLVLTLFSREGGSPEKIDLVLFSTLNINTRNTAYVAENILLFVPYAYLGGWNFKGMRKFISCTLIGLCTSLFIETTQLFTGRGVFQVDDIWTNTLGMLLGCILYRIFAAHGRKIKQRQSVK